MTVGRFTVLNKIDIWQPRYKDRKVLIAKYKVQERNLIVFTKAEHLKGREFFLTGKEIQSYPLSGNGKIPCYEVSFDDLEVLERQDERIYDETH